MVRGVWCVVWRALYGSQPQCHTSVIPVLVTGTQRMCAHVSALCPAYNGEPRGSHLGGSLRLHLGPSDKHWDDEELDVGEMEAHFGVSQEPVFSVSWLK